MFCKNCGSELDESSNFCSNCGSKINLESIVEYNQGSQDYYVKCIKCGKIEHGPMDPNNEEEAEILRGTWLDRTCPICNEDQVIAFIGHCSDCNKNVFFNMEKLTKAIGNMALSAAGSLGKILKDPGHIIDHGADSLQAFSVPYASSVGECPFCHHLYFKCPTCDSAVKVPIDARGALSVVTCNKCGTKMKRP
jgi:hypothetical protein